MKDAQSRALTENINDLYIMLAPLLLGEAGVRVCPEGKGCKSSLNMLYKR